ncbi:hypothetical protein TRFO_40900 [Tritrichomonas foetus]|uniref:Uncharacterized protein n=1 Tax=Tritrichomonas foetus TaxID=1144522 RepID=A0A1J4J5R4_9EUKA|nr:hypothetical protein TRFO_40900 [Tritrichomonas foetus]|eukprot:OHS92797.1 hypothetical protein TRFO_40900 [Tritrichomonas foetus]
MSFQEGAAIEKFPHITSEPIHPRIIKEQLTVVRSRRRNARIDFSFSHLIFQKSEEITEKIIDGRIPFLSVREYENLRIPEILG